ncbi:CopG family transcriptional regulator [Mycolicibacter heraklionensis]|uniref:CopG family transcriptional regulator n=1 Tax=Mycolicibacter heraklionensis TaxID=512402 RepID=A0AA91EVW8_9MYCO|nr:CopG family transcriptional regulator [Mycolicibacter heraklionensis]
MLNVRTTVVIDSDVAAEIERLRRQGLGISEALNLLARRGIAAQASAPEYRYRHRTAPIGLKVDVSNVAEVLDLLDDDR